MSKLQHTIFLAIICVLSVAVIGLLASRSHDRSTVPATQRVVVFPIRSLDSDSDGLAANVTSALVQSLKKSPNFVIVQDFELPPTMRNISEHHLWPKDQNVSLIFEGTIRRTGEYYQITVQIVDGYSDSHLWSETFESTDGNVQWVLDSVESKVLTLAAR
jgi:TolB-like protein